MYTCTGCVRVHPFLILSTNYKVSLLHGASLAFIILYVFTRTRDGQTFPSSDIDLENGFFFFETVDLIGGERVHQSFDDDNDDPNHQWTVKSKAGRYIYII